MMDQKLKEALQVIYDYIWQKTPSLKENRFRDEDVIKVIKATSEIAYDLNWWSREGWHANDVESYKKPTMIVFCTNDSIDGTLIIRCAFANF